MMFFFHFFTFPTWWIDGIEYPLLVKLEPYINLPLNTCVPIFCFLSGYSYYFVKEKNYQYSFRKNTDILIYYWAVFFLYSFIAVLSVNYVYSPKDYICEMLILTNPTMPFNWFVRFYVLYMLMLPILSKILPTKIHFNLFVSIVFIPTLLYFIKFIFLYLRWNIAATLVNEFITWFPALLSGYIFANYKIFFWMDYFFKKKIRSKKLSIILFTLGAIDATIGRAVNKPIILTSPDLPLIRKSISIVISTDLYTPIFIFCIINICRTMKCNKMQFILKEIGKYSLMMWFVSCIFFNNSRTVFQPILYWLKNPVLVLLWGLFICYLISKSLDLVIKYIIRLKNKTIFHII